MAGRRSADPGSLLRGVQADPRRPRQDPLRQGHRLAAGIVSATATTLPTLPVSKQVQNNLRPWFKGTAKVGERLKVKPGVWRPLFVVKFKYRWYADGHAYAVPATTDCN